VVVGKGGREPELVIGWWGCPPAGIWTHSIVIVELGPMTVKGVADGVGSETVGTDIVISNDVVADRTDLDVVVASAAKSSTKDDAEMVSVTVGSTLVSGAEPVLNAAEVVAVSFEDGNEHM
jgi:hypothetical protein